MTDPDGLLNVWEPVAGLEHVVARSIKVSVVEDNQEGRRVVVPVGPVGQPHALQRRRQDTLPGRDRGKMIIHRGRIRKLLEMEMKNRGRKPTRVSDLPTKDDVGLSAFPGFT